MNNRSLGVLCLCAFLILFGLLTLTNIRFDLSNVLLGALAIAAGVLLFIGR